MSEFIDGKGRTWRLAIDGGHVLRAKRVFGVNLPGMFADGSKSLSALVADFEKLVGVFWILIEEQADVLDVKPEAFAAGLTGDAFQAAINAFVEALIDFFPSAAQRAALREIWMADKTMTETAMNLMAQNIATARSSIDASLKSQALPE